MKKKYGNLNVCVRLAFLIMVQLFQSLLFRGSTFDWIDIVFFYRIGSLFFNIDQSKCQIMYIKSIKSIYFGAY